MSNLLFRRSTGNLSGHNQEEVEVTEESLELLLEEDSTLVEFFNAFLALLMFPVRLHYNPDTGCFEEFKHKLADDAIDNNVKRATGLKRFSFFKSTIDDKGSKIGYYVKFLDKSTGFDWVKKNRLPFFLKSELFAEYKLARTLSVAQTRCLMNFMIDSLNLKKTAFDEGSSPQYRIQRNHGTLPGLAEFQERMKLLEDGLDSNSEEVCSDSASCVSDLEDIEFSEIHTEARRRERTRKSNFVVDSDCLSIASSFEGNHENESLSETNELLNLSGDNHNKDDSKNVLPVEDKLRRTSPNIDWENHKTVISQEDVIHPNAQDKDVMTRKRSIELSLERKRNEMNTFGIASVVRALRNELESVRIDSNVNIENGNRETGLFVNDFEGDKIEVEEEEKGPLETKLEDEMDTTRNIAQEFVSNDISAISVQKDETNSNQDATQCKRELNTVIYALEGNEVEGSLGNERILFANNKDVDTATIDNEILRNENEISQLNDDSADDKSVSKKVQPNEMNSFDNSVSNQFSFEVKMIENEESVTEESSNHLNQASLIGESINRVSSDQESQNHEEEEAKESISSLAVIHISQKRHSMPNEKHLLENALAEEGLQDDVFSNEPLPRRPSFPTNTLRRRLSTLSMSSTLEEMNDLLANEMLDFKNKNSKDTLRKLLEDSESGDDDDDDENDVSSNNVTRKPIDIASKEGMDAFKMFLVDTPGEKLFLLWIEIERLKSCDNLQERTSIMKEIRQRFFRSGATFELTNETLRGWNITSFGNVDFKTLTDIQPHVLKPLQIYWCARFTLHQKRKHVSVSSEYVTDDHTCMNTRCSTHQREMSHVPQRPNTCFPGFRAKADRSKKELEKGHACNIKQKGTSEHSVELVEDMRSPSGVDSSRTKSRIRSKSAHPRLIGTSNPKEINLSQQQLQIITTMDESCGYRPAPNYNYKSDAATMDEKDNVRLYIQPAPPPDCKVSTVIKAIYTKEEERKLEEKQERDRTSLMDSLVECLLHEKHSGQFFYNHLLVKDNKLWTDCYHFWRALQDYNEHFFCDTFNPDLIKQKAGFIFSTFIVSGSKQTIYCDVKLQMEIHKRLDPPYEELFDNAEEHALKLLADAYSEIFQEESIDYEELKKNEKLKYLDVRKRIKRPSHKPKEKAKNDENGEDDYDDIREKISIEEMNSPLPVSSDGVTFDSFIRNKQDVDSFKEFLQRTNNKGLKDLLAWTEMENFRRSSRRHNQRNEVAKSVNTNWLNEEYFFGPSSPATKEAQAEVRKLGNKAENIERPPSPMILEAQKYVRARIERRWLVLFKETSIYQGRHKENNITEMVEDMIMKRRLQRSEAAWKILNSRWVSGSRDVVALRQALMDPEKCKKFRKFLSLKGELMDHNVYFWLEVQKYKDLCHRHVEELIIKSKVQAIVDVFIKSAIPPELQIDVPIEIAERLYEKATGRLPQLGPYLFREAQTTVFRIMFSYWKEFVTFKASIEEEKLGQHLEELDKKHKAQVKAKRMVTERRRLARIAHEKRKKERVEEERSKERERMSSRFEKASTIGREKALSLITEDEEMAMQTRSFSYSKFTIEQELQSLEQRMRDEGYTVDEITEGELTQSYFTSDRKTIRRASGIISDDQKSISALSARKGKRTSDILSKLTRGSLIHEPIFESTEAVFSKQNKRTSEGRSREKQSSGSVISSREGTAVNRDFLSPKHQLLLNLRQKHDDAKSVGRISSVSDVGKLNRSSSSASLMPGPQRTSNKSGTVLTTKSLREFSKSPQGKPLDGPLPLINITKEAPGIDKSTTTKTMERRPKSTQSIISNRDARVKRPITSKFRKDEDGNHSAAFVAKIIVT